MALLPPITVSWTSQSQAAAAVTADTSPWYGLGLRGSHPLLDSRESRAETAYSCSSLVIPHSLIVCLWPVFDLGGVVLWVVGFVES